MTDKTEELAKAETKPQLLNVGWRPGDPTPLLNAALAKAQGAFVNAKKDVNNPFFNSKYADLAGIFDACRKPLADNGLAIAQTVVTDANGVTVTTHLLHASGESISSPFWVPVVKKDPQGYGSACTYARRFSLQALVGVAAEVDDDANSHATQPAPAATYKKKGTVPQNEPQMVEALKASITERQVAIDTGTSTKEWSDLGEPLTLRAKIEVKLGEAATTEELAIVAATIAPFAEKNELSAGAVKELRTVYAKRAQQLLKDKK